MRVPAFLLDLSESDRLGPGGRQFSGIFHISDWLPTFLSLAGDQGPDDDLRLDGVDQTEALKTGKPVRNNDRSL